MEKSKNIIEAINQFDLNHFLQYWIVPYGTKIFMALIIFFVGRIIVKLITKVILKIIDKSTKDPMLNAFIASIISFLGLIIVLVAALSQLGVNTSSIVALIGAAGLAIGLSLKDSLQNFAAGIMILIFKPFRRDDFIESGNITGTVVQIGIMMLELKTPDNKMVLIPNGKVFSENIINYSINNTRRIDLILDISYDSDLRLAKSVISDIIDQHPKVLKQLEVTVAVGALGASSVQIYARPWVRVDDYLSTLFELTESIKLALDKAGIEIPFNKLDVNLVSANLESSKIAN